MNKGYLERDDYSEYEGANFTPLLQRMRELPFGSKFQNHALNSRANDEFHKYFPEDNRRPILRDVSARKYWINESLLTVSVKKCKYNLARVVLQIIDLYIGTKRESFRRFIGNCKRLQKINKKESDEAAMFIRSLLSPERDARLFEIASYAVLKAHFSTKIIFIGRTRDTIEEEALKLFKTGRTNANDGGIDFVTRPLGKFFQVTETLDSKKYFLDIDKIERYPISFVIKTTLEIDEIRSRLEDGAKEQYGVQAIIRRYMAAIEEIFNIPRLLAILDNLARQRRIAEVLDEIIRWSNVEFDIGNNSN